MQVILLQDIARIGRKHEVKNVPDGHAYNYLIPRRLAVPATEQHLQQQREQEERIRAHATQSAVAGAKFFAHAKLTPVVVTASANEQGHLFRGLHATDIARILSEQAGFTIMASAVALARPIKEIGEYPLMLTIGTTQGKIQVNVVAKTAK